MWSNTVLSVDIPLQLKLKLRIKLMRNTIIKIYAKPYKIRYSNTVTVIISFV